ncbi:MAG: DUF4251 domain-containing protein [Paludibacter sp.]|nr:DUF4251 domain-containing protein [Paludibacter sp.]
MKKIIIILLLAIPGIGLLAQKKAANSPVTKVEKQDSDLEKQYQLNKYMLENRDFVLEADYLQNRYGRRSVVNSTINFVAVDSTTAIIQIGSDFRVGSNGVGGVTAKGKITSWKLTENTKNMTFNLYLNVMTNIGIYDLYFSISSSGKSTALLTGLTAGQLTFEGDLVPHSESSVYEGFSSYR